MEDFKKWLQNNYYGKKTYKAREMKRIFQFRRYLEWKDLTEQEKLTAKRLFLIPILAFPLLVMIKVYTPVFVTGLIVWFLYQRFDKGRLTK
tara:strand:+ start:257 stop:529 length:273 start_codon:yes stop_codon:yes gene_type:complete